MDDTDYKLLQKVRDVIDVFEARDHRIVQIGDNDSGRILKLNPLFLGDKEDCLNPKEVKNLLDFMLGRSAEGVYAKLLKSYGNAFKIENEQSNSYDYNSPQRQAVGGCECDYPYKKQNVFCAEIGSIIKTEYIADFGLIKVQCKNADVYIRAVPEYKKMDTSHAHDDVFGFQVIFDDRRFNEDLGSIVYTSDKKKRDYFASSESHGVPLHSKEIVKRIDTFVTDASADGFVTIEKEKIIVEARWEDIIHKREFVFTNSEIKITDYSNEGFEIKPQRDEYYSLGYGQLYLG